jgi:hypothetical protein
MNNTVGQDFILRADSSALSLDGLLSGKGRLKSAAG